MAGIIFPRKATKHLNIFLSFEKCEILHFFASYLLSVVVANWNFLYFATFVITTFITQYCTHVTNVYLNTINHNVGTYSCVVFGTCARL